MKMGEKVDL